MYRIRKRSAGEKLDITRKLSLFKGEILRISLPSRREDIRGVSIDTLRDVLAESETEINETVSAAPRYYIRAGNEKPPYSLPPHFSVFQENFAPVTRRDDRFSELFAKSNENRGYIDASSRPYSRKMARSKQR